jgi:hypothetical protein
VGDRSYRLTWWPYLLPPNDVVSSYTFPARMEQEAAESPGVAGRAGAVATLGATPQQRSE